MGTTRSLAACIVALAALAAVTAGLAQGSDEIRAPRRDALPAGQPAESALGEQLYLESCATCHGAEGAGTPYGPDLRGVGAAAVDFQLSTGRMPFAEQPGTQAQRKPSPFTQEQIDSLVEYVVSLGEGRPQGPAIPTVTLDEALLSRGHEIFAGNCAPCHGATGHGGAVGGDALAPSLHVATPVQTVEAILTGPGQMPRFQLAEDDLDAVATYVDYLQRARNPGGFSIGGIGPVPEGFVGWVLGMGLLLVVVVLVGREWRLSAANNPQTPERPEE